MGLLIGGCLDLFAISGFMCVLVWSTDFLWVEVSNYSIGYENHFPSILIYKENIMWVKIGILYVL